MEAPNSCRDGPVELWHPQDNSRSESEFTAHSRNVARGERHIVTGCYNLLALIFVTIFTLLEITWRILKCFCKSDKFGMLRLCNEIKFVFLLMFYYCFRVLQINLK